MEKNLVEYNCPSDVFMKVLKGKCKTTLLVLIKKEVNRFGEMKRALPTISERMLAKQLDELEADGILSRTVFGSNQDYTISTLVTIKYSCRKTFQYRHALDVVWINIQESG